MRGHFLLILGSICGFLACRPLVGHSIKGRIDPGDVFVKYVRFVNYSSTAQRNVFTATIPFKPSECWRGEQQIRVRGAVFPKRSVVIRPLMGTDGPVVETTTGCYRFAVIHAPMELASNQSRVLEVIFGDGQGAHIGRAQRVPDNPFAHPTRFAPKGTSTAAGGDGNGFVLGPDLFASVVNNQPRIHVAVDEPGGGLNQITVDFSQAEAISANDAEYVLKIERRIGSADSAFALRVWLHLGSGEDVIRFYARVTASTPNRPQMVHPIGARGIRMGFSGGLPWIYGLNRLGGQVVPTAGKVFSQALVEFNLYPDPDSGSAFGGRHMGEGQSLTYAGLVGYPGQNDARDFLSATSMPSFGVSLDWSKTFGVFKHIPSPRFATQSEVDAAVANRAQTFLQWVGSRGNLWDDRPFGLLPSTGATGNQHDFGPNTAPSVFLTLYRAVPLFAFQHYLNASEEAVRPTHFLETDGSPMRGRNHPNWVSYSQTTHFGVTRDNLGKDPSAPRNTHGYSGKDSHHVSSNNLHATYMLYPIPQLRYEIENEVTHFLADFHTPTTFPSGGAHATVGSGGARTQGRIALAMLQHYLAIGDERIADRLRARFLEVVLPDYRSYSNGNPIKVMDGDLKDCRLIARFVSGQCVETFESFSPWQESIWTAAMLAQAYVLKDLAPLDVARESSVALTLYSWGKPTPGGNYELAYAQRYNNGQPIPLSLYNNSEWIVWSGALWLWTMPTVVAVEKYFPRSSTEALQRAKEIQLQRRPRGGVYTDFEVWSALP